MIRILIMAAMLLMWGCAGQEAEDSAKVEGVWQESFTYRSLIPLPEDETTPEVVAELALDNGRFSVSFFPFDSILAHSFDFPDSLVKDSTNAYIIADSVYMSYLTNPAVLPLKPVYKGRYTLREDIITFITDDYDFEREYRFSVSDDELMLETWPVSLTLAEFIWANSAFKSSGVFKKRPPEN